MIKKIFETYIHNLKGVDTDCKLFLMRQIERMPDYYRFGVKALILLFFILNVKPASFKLLDRLFSSLITIKKYEI